MVYTKCFHFTQLFLSFRCSLCICDVNNCDPLIYLIWFCAHGIRCHIYHEFPRFTEYTDDSCNSTPSFYSIKLPSDCINPSTGNDILNVGRCNNEHCVSRKSPTGTSGDCQDEECCCGPLDTESVQVTCQDFVHINMTRVTRCGCGPCERRETVLKGN